MEEVNEEVHTEEETSISNNISEEREIYIRTFIHFVESNAQLYAKKTKGYSKGQDKVVTWAQLGAIMTFTMDGTEASKLFHKLREKFGKERKKVVQSMPRSGAGAGVATYSSPWIFYKELEFLTNHIQARQTSTNLVRRAGSPAIRPVHSPVPLSSHPSAPKTVAVPTLSPAWNIDLAWLSSPASNGSSSDCTELVATEDSSEVSSNSNPQSPPTISVLKAKAASIQPAKSVPAHDTVKKRKRESEKLRDAISDSKQEIKDLASSLGDALKNFVKPAAAPSPKPSSSVPPQVEAMMQPIIIAFSRVPDDDQLDCVQAMLSVLQQYIPKRTPNN